MQLTMNSQELWDGISTQIDAIKFKGWLDPVLVDKFDSLQNHYSGTLASGNQETLLGDVEIIVNNLSQDSYYKTKQYKEAEAETLQKLNEDLGVFYKVISAEIREAKKAPKPEAKGRDRLPNPDVKEVQKVYQQSQNARPRL
jgi:hypothetical protein